MQKNFEFANLTDKGLVRKANEDSHGYFETANGDVFVLCDGMGGHIGGAVASQTAVEAIKNYYETATSHDKIAIALQVAIERANNTILEKVAADSSLQGMGTTIVLLVINDNKVYYGHVGDSRIYLFQNDKLTQLTKDHSFVQSLVDKGLITAAEAEKHPRKNQITQALGTSENLEPDVSEASLSPQPGDCFLLCSDGLTGMVSDQFIKDVLAAASTLEEKAKQLVDEANKNGGLDNITVQIIRFN